VTLCSEGGHTSISRMISRVYTETTSQLGSDTKETHNDHRAWPGANDKIDYICKRLESHEKTFGNSAVWYRRVFFWTSIVTLLLTGMITVIAGIQTTPEFPHQVQQDSILVLGAIATIVSGWGLFFSPKDSWLIYANSLNRLRALRSKIQFLKSSPSTIKSDEQFASETYAERKYNRGSGRFPQRTLNARASVSSPRSSASLLGHIRRSI